MERVSGVLLCWCAQLWQWWRGWLGEGWEQRRREREAVSHPPRLRTQPSPSCAWQRLERTFSGFMILWRRPTSKQSCSGAGHTTDGPIIDALASGTSQAAAATVRYQQEAVGAQAACGTGCNEPSPPRRAAAASYLEEGAQVGKVAVGDELLATPVVLHNSDSTGWGTVSRPVRCQTPSVREKHRLDQCLRPRPQYGHAVPALPPCPAPHLRHHEAAQDGTHVTNLGVHPPALLAPAQHIHLVCGRAGSNGQAAPGLGGPVGLAKALWLPGACAARCSHSPPLPPLWPTQTYTNLCILTPTAPPPAVAAAGAPPC